MEWKDDEDVLKEEEAEAAAAAASQSNAALPSHDDNGKWLGVCLDDGTGRNVYFVSPDGTRSRRAPEGYEPEYFSNGERRYYYRNTCIRCRRTKQAPIFLTYSLGGMAYSLNMCDECHLKTVPGTTRLRGNSVAFLRVNADTPKNAWIDLKTLALSPTRNQDILLRSRAARSSVQKDMKNERNKQRFVNTRRLAREYGIDDGVYISWGYGAVFDEYYGELNADGQPHGMGCKFYSDGSVYYGGFQGGEHHTDKRGVWVRLDGSTYDGTWQFNQRHGQGLQIYPAGGRYEGQWAKGFEHGQGKRVYPDGSTFEGRFRFGRKDGPGVFVDKDGKMEKGSFSPDPGEKWNEKWPPVIEEEDNLNEEFHQPLSLLELAVSALAKAMHTNRNKLAPSRRLTLFLPEHTKKMVAYEYLRTMNPPGSTSFQQAGPHFAFTSVTELVFQDVKLKQADCEALMYFQGGNSNLTLLRMTSNKFDLASLDRVCGNLRSGAWPVLQTVDLSYNKFDLSALDALLAGVRCNPTICNLRLASCQIKAPGFFSLAKWISVDKQLLSLDVAFNLAESAGAQLLADALELNTTLTSLNLRGNRISQMGGQAFCDAIKNNRSLRVLCVADNGIGPDLLSLISGRLQGSCADVVKSVLIYELNLPNIYREGRYDFFAHKMAKKGVVTNKE